MTWKIRGRHKSLKTKLNKTKSLFRHGPKPPNWRQLLHIHFHVTVQPFKEGMLPLIGNKGQFNSRLVIEN